MYGTKASTVPSLSVPKVTSRTKSLFVLRPPELILPTHLAFVPAGLLIGAPKSVPDKIPACTVLECTATKLAMPFSTIPPNALPLKVASVIRSRLCPLTTTPILSNPVAEPFRS